MNEETEKFSSITNEFKMKFVIPINNPGELLPSTEEEARKVLRKLRESWKEEVHFTEDASSNPILPNYHNWHGNG